MTAGQGPRAPEERLLGAIFGGEGQAEAAAAAAPPARTGPRFATSAAQLARLKHQRNQRVKLFASFLNTIGAAMATIGTVTPVVAWFFGLTTAPDTTAERLFIGGVFWLCMAGAVHFLGSLTLGLLGEP